MEFGDYIKAKRLEKGLTQAQLAKKLGIVQTYITYLEKGERNPSDDIIAKIAKELDLPAERLLFLANPKLQKMVSSSPDKKEMSWNPLLQELKINEALRKKHAITDEELESLASIKNKGKIRKIEDYVFLLMTIRQLFQE